MRTIDIVAAVLLVVGGLNLGVVGVVNFDLVAGLFGSEAMLSRLVYTLVGAAAVYQALSLRAIQKRWNVRAAMA